MALHFAFYLEEGRRLRAQGASDEDLLQFFRTEGASMLDSVKLMKAIKQVSLREAQDLIHFSKTWEDHREQQAKLHDQFIEAAGQLGAAITYDEEE